MESTTPAVHTQQTGSSNTGKIISIVVLVLLISIGGFVGGMQYQKGKTTNVATTSANGGFGPGGNGGPGMNRNGSFGTVSAVDDSSITVKDQRAGSSKTYSISSSTTVTDSGSTASVSDIQTGDTVMVQTASQSSTAATQIVLNPSMGGPAGATGSGTTQTN